MKPWTGLAQVAPTSILAALPAACSLTLSNQVEQLGKNKVLKMSLLRECIANALKWTFIQH